MKFRCERDSLVEVLATAGRAVGTRSSAQMVLSGLRIEAVGNRLSVVGTDLDLTVHVSTEAIGITDGVCVAPAKLLADIVAVARAGCGDHRGARARRSRSARRVRGSACAPSRWTTSPHFPSPPSRPRSCPPAAWPARCARWSGPRRVTTPDRS